MMNFVLQMMNFVSSTDVDLAECIDCSLYNRIAFLAVVIVRAATIQHCQRHPWKAGVYTV